MKKTRLEQLETYPAGSKVLTKSRREDCPAAGQTAKSAPAFANLRIEIVDLLREPQLARGGQIPVVPALVGKLPELERKPIGDLSNTNGAPLELDLRPKNESGEQRKLKNE